MKIKNLIINFLKFAFAGLIIFYMIYTKKLDVNEISKIIHYKLLVLEVSCIILAIFGLVSIRWYYLLRWQGIPTNLWAVTRITLTGCFFNSFMPGAVGGDIVKAIYIAKENKDFRTRAITTIFIDRVIGLFTLMIVAFVALVINYKIILSNPILKALGISIAGFILCGILFATTVFSKRIKTLLVNIGVRELVYKLPLHQIMIQIYHAFHIYHNQKTRLLKAMFVTIILDLLNVYVMYTIGRTMGETSMSIASYFTAIPAGFVTLSLPVAPAGLGVGQAAFYNLFIWFGAKSGELGATVVTIYQLINISLNMMFVVFYLQNKKEVDKALKESKQ